MPKKNHHVAIIISSIVLVCALTALSAALGWYLGTRRDVPRRAVSRPHASRAVSIPAAQSSAVSTASSEQTFEDYLNDTLFIGDSRTNGMVQYHCLPAKNVLAKNGETPEGARTDRFVQSSAGPETVTQAVAERKPYRMVVSYGVNGFAFMGRDAFMKDYAALLDGLHAASPDSILIVQSILPVSQSRQEADPRYDNSVIDKYNGLIKAMAVGRGFRFLDSSRVLKDDNNCLAAQYDCGDGLHFNGAAYQALMRFYKSNR